MTTKHHIEIVEVGPRDGLQSEPGVLPTATKVEFINRVVAGGARRVEVTSFVNPKKVPQMADAEEVMKALPRRAGVHYIGLVLNRKGFERAAAAGCNEIGMAVVASNTFNQRNQGVTTEESIAAWLDIAAAAQQAGIAVQVTVSAAFGCPFEGEVPVARVVEIVQRVADAHPFEIALADTIGVGVPAQVTELLSRVREAVPGIPLRCHFPQYPQYRARERLCCGAGGRQDPGCQPRRDRRLPVCTGGHRQHPDGRPGLHAAAVRLRHRDFAGPCHRDGQVAAGAARPAGARHAGQGRRLPEAGGACGLTRVPSNPRIAANCRKLNTSKTRV